MKDISYPKTSSARDFFVIGIGASAGGLEALKSFFENMPEDNGMAYVIIQHLSPDYKSLMAELLSKHTKMQVNRVADGMSVASNQIYLIPPKKNMHIYKGKLYLTKQPPRSTLNLPIDIFFRSLAEDMENRSVGIILSGTGSDGTLGIRAIKGAGGMVMVQDETTAKFDGMPRSAIYTGLVDYILPPEKMPGQLLRFIQHPFIVKKMESESTDDLSKILSIIKHQTGFDFSFYKLPTIIRRVERRIGINQKDSIEDYVTMLESSPKEAETLSKELLIGVTKFFRDREAFDILKEKVIPEIFEGKNPYDTIRVWSVGCSTGEEAYSLAILLNEYSEQIGKPLNIQVFATDIDRESIEYAGGGMYPASIITDIEEDTLKKYFSKRGDYYKINDNIRRMVVFASHNITRDPPFSKIDFISCRNLLIYFKPSMQKRAISIFRFALNDNGYLFLGSSESIGELTSYFLNVSNKWKIFKCLVAQKPRIIGDIYPHLSNQLVMGRDKKDDFMPVLSESDDLLTQLGLELFNEFMPPAVIINDNMELLYVFKNAHKYLRINPGKVNLNILSLIVPELNSIVSTAIHKAVKSNKQIEYEEVSTGSEDDSEKINLVVRPYKYKNNKSYMLVIFQKPEKTGFVPDALWFEGNGASNQRLKDLEQELQYTRENLQATIEELETSNEELQATNEELIASNEELQSANEELQSLNEELYTVNSEYQNKIEELTELNNDINNWLSASNIGSIFLDLQLRLRKFTPLAQKAVNVIDNDIGRSIKHLSYNFKYDDFFDKIDAVAQSLISIETEVQNVDGMWFLLKIIPYRTIQNAVKGVAITFIDITEIKLLEDKLAMERDLLLRILENSSVAKTIISKSGEFSYANSKAQKLLHLEKNEVKSSTYNSPKWVHYFPDGRLMPEYDYPFNIIMRTRKNLTGYKCVIRMNEGKELKLCISGSPIFGEGGEVNGVVFSLVDMNEVREQKDKKYINDNNRVVAEGFPDEKIDC